MEKRQQVRNVVLSKELISVALDYLGFEAVCKYGRLVCTTWAYGLYFRYIEWDMDRCSFKVMTKIVNPASVRIVKLRGTRGCQTTALQFFTNARILYIDQAAACALEQTSFSHVFQERGRVTTYPYNLHHLFAKLSLDELGNLHLPHLTVFDGCSLPLSGVLKTPPRVGQLPVYWDVHSRGDIMREDFSLAPSLPKTYRVELSLTSYWTLQAISRMGPADNLYASLCKVHVSLQLDSHQWMVLAKLPNLESVEIVLCKTFEKSLCKQQYAWPSLKHIGLTGARLDYLGLFLDAVHLWSITVCGVHYYASKNPLVLQNKLTVQRLVVEECICTVFDDIRHLAFFREVHGSIAGSEYSLDFLHLTETVRKVDLFIETSLLADTIAGFVFRHRFNDVTLRAEGFFFKELHKVERLANVTYPLRLGLQSYRSIVNCTLQCQSELEKVTNFFVYYHDDYPYDNMPNKDAEEAFHAFIRENEQLIKAF